MRPLTARPPLLSLSPAQRAGSARCADGGEPASLDALRTLDTLITRALDTVEDAYLMARRAPAKVIDSRDSLVAWQDPVDSRPRVLIIGSGWAAHALVKTIDADLYRLLVISPRNYFVFTPMLAAASVGTVEYRSVTEPMRAANQRAAFIEGTIEDIMPKARTAKALIGDDEVELNYDLAIVACGVRSTVSKVPGVSENCYFLKELEDAQRLRRAVGSLLERASQPGLTEERRRELLTLIVVGGGPTGVEYCGELSDFLLDAAARLYPKLLPLAQVVLLHGGKDVLPAFDPPLRARALATLRDRGVEVRLGTRVEGIESPTRLTIKTRVGEGDGDEAWERSMLTCGLIMWAAGTGPRQLTTKIIERIEEDVGELGTRCAYGRITVDPWLRVVGAPAGSMLALGDACCCPDVEGKPLPQTAQVAAQQGAYVARILNRKYDLASGLPPDTPAQPTPMDPPSIKLPEDIFDAAGTYFLLRGALQARPFEFLNLGLLAYVGGGKALSQVQVGDQRLLSQAGSTGFLLWRSVYVVKQVSPRTRFLVLFDWFKTRAFGRDITGI